MTTNYVTKFSGANPVDTSGPIFDNGGLVAVGATAGLIEKFQVNGNIKIDDGSGNPGTNRIWTTRKVFNVLDYGAVSDGAYNGANPLAPLTTGTDNTSFFQDAIDDANSAGGGIVFVPVGYYKFTGHLTITQNVTLLGEAGARSDFVYNNSDNLDWVHGIKQGSVLLPTETGTTPFIDMGYRNAVIKNITIFYGEQKQPSRSYSGTGTCTFTHGSTNITGVSNRISFISGMRIQGSDGLWYDCTGNNATNGGTVTISSAFNGTTGSNPGFIGYIPFSPTAYPWAIRGTHTSWDIYDITIKDVRIVNAYNGIDLGKPEPGTGTERHSARVNVHNLCCLALHTGIFIDGCWDVSVFRDIYLFDIGCYLDTGNGERATLLTYLVQNLTAFEIRRTDDVIIDNFAVFGCKTGLLFGKGMQDQGCWGQLSNILVDCAVTGFFIEPLGINGLHGAKITNFTINSYDWFPPSPPDPPGWPFEFTGTCKAIVCDPTTGLQQGAILALENGTFANTYFQRHIEWYGADNGNLLISNCHFECHTTQIGPFDSIVLNTGKASISNCFFRGDFGVNNFAINSVSGATVIANGNIYNGNKVGGTGGIYSELVPSQLTMDLVNGLLGLGEPAPGAKIDLVYSGAGARGIEINCGANALDGVAIIANGIALSNLALFVYNSANKMGVDFNGNGFFMGSLGLGVSNPSTKLEISGDVKTNTGSIRAFGTNSQGINLEPGVSDSTYSDLGFYNSGWKNGRIDGANLVLQTKSGGNVGVGTAQPSAKLHIYEGGGNVTALVESAANEAQLDLKSGSDFTRLFYRDSDDAFGIYHKGTTRLRIKSDGTMQLNENGGNVGIGLTNPSQKLDVNGNINATGYYAGGTQGKSVTINYQKYSSGNGTMTFTNGILTAST